MPIFQHVFTAWRLIKQETRPHSVVLSKHRDKFTFYLKGSASPGAGTNVTRKGVFFFTNLVPKSPALHVICIIDSTK
jgi:hypothetical protein